MTDPEDNIRHREDADPCPDWKPVSIVSIDILSLFRLIKDFLMRVKW